MCYSLSHSVCLSVCLSRLHLQKYSGLCPSKILLSVHLKQVRFCLFFSLFNPRFNNLLSNRGMTRYEHFANVQRHWLFLEKARWQFFFFLPVFFSGGFTQQVSRMKNNPEKCIKLENNSLLKIGTIWPIIGIASFWVLFSNFTSQLSTVIRFL